MRSRRRWRRTAAGIAATVLITTAVAAVRHTGADTTPPLDAAGAALAGAARGTHWQATPTMPPPVPAWQTGNVPGCRHGGLIRGVDTHGDKVVTFTFDDGPDPATSERIMDVFAAHQATATFFDVGINTLTHPDLVRDEVARGFTVGNHTVTHHFDPATIAKEIPTMNGIIHHVTGVTTPYFRSPGLVDTPAIDHALSVAGMCEVTTDVDVGDWHHVPRSAATLCATFRDTLHPGEIVGLHDGETHQPTVDALGCMLDTLTAVGYRAVSLDDLLADGTPYIGTPAGGG